MEAKYRNGKASLSPKKKWIDMEITRVKLNPEQAVLSCCSQLAGRAAATDYNCAGGACPGVASAPNS